VEKSVTNEIFDDPLLPLEKFNLSPDGKIILHTPLVMRRLMKVGLNREKAGHACFRIFSVFGRSFGTFYVLNIFYFQWQ
jgi:hypothetical protein